MDKTDDIFETSIRFEKKYQYQNKKLNKIQKINDSKQKMKINVIIFQ